MALSDEDLEELMEPMDLGEYVKPLRSDTIATPPPTESGEQLDDRITQPLPVPLILSGLILLMTIMTNVVSNNAAAVIGTPVSISIAQQLNVPVEPFILAVIFGANMSFATPIGYHTNLLIMSAGGYRFTDFLRIGIPLTLIMWLAFTIILPIQYGL